MTPELQDLADYRVTARTIDVIGDSAVVLSTRMNRKVGVMGLSFAGGLSLLTAAKPEFAADRRAISTSWSTFRNTKSSSVTETICIAKCRFHFQPRPSVVKCRSQRLKAKRI